MSESPAAASSPAPQEAPFGANAALVLADGTVFWGRGLGIAGTSNGEVCFNTSLTGYQEILTDPSYAGQIITFTFPHIGNVGANPEDIETNAPAARGLILRCDVTEPSNWRAAQHLDAWLKSSGLIGIAGLDTRAITKRIREIGAPHGCIGHAPDGKLDIAALQKQAAGFAGLKGLDLAKEVTCLQTYKWDETPWSLEGGYGKLEAPKHKVVAIDYGAKRNILRCLAGLGCDVTVVPASATTEEILAHQPDGVFLSNGPGDPAATGTYAVPVIQDLLKRDLPIFGICLGHRGANHPVKDLETGRVEITSQNHGFEVVEESLPEGVEASHVSLFDGTNEGLRVKDRPVFSVQYHPEASPGPHDSHYLFERFVANIDAAKKK